MPFTSVKIKMDAAFAGMMVDSTDHDTASYVQKEASAEIAFGEMVRQGVLDDEALRLSANTQKCIGVVRHQHFYAINIELGTVGLKPKTTLGVCKRGKMWVVSDEAVTPNSPVRVRCTDVGGRAGVFRTTASAGNTLNCSNFARFLNTTTGAGPVQLEFDCTGRNLATAD